MRTTVAAVKKILEVDLDIIAEDEDFDPFIETASGLVDDCCLGFSYSDEKLERIERWLAAHIYRVRDPQASSQSAEGVGETYAASLGLGLQNTMYGQTALLIDTSGGLAMLNAKTNKGTRRKIGITALGSNLWPST